MMRDWQIAPRTRRVAQYGLLCAVALIAAALEQLMPTAWIGVPGAKPGISNVVVLTAAELCGPGAAFSVIAVKAVFALATRGVTAAMMSFSGGVLSGTVMLLLLRSHRFGTVGLSIAGAVAHNWAQVTVASVLLSADFGVYLPVLMGLALISGTLTGLLYGVLRPRLMHLQTDARP